MRKSNQERGEFVDGYKRIIVGGVIGVFALILFLIFKPFVMIGPGERGVVLRFGAVEERILGEGMQWRTPFAERIVTIGVRIYKAEVDAPSFSKDLQNVDTKIALNFHYDPAFVNKLYQQVGNDAYQNIIMPAIQESVKAATAQFTAADLIGERPKVKDVIKTHLVERLTPRFIIVDDFSIVDFQFSSTYQQAIEQKQVAQQKALEAENDLRRIKVEAEQRVAQATAEAEAIRIQAQAITSQGGHDYVQMKAISKWDGHLPTQMIPGSTVPFLDLNGGGK